MVNAKVRGNRIYMYQSWRTKADKIRSKYLGTFEAWFRREYETSLVEPETYKLLSKKDRMDKSKRLLLSDLKLGVLHEFHNSKHEKKRLNLAERIAIAKSRRSHGHTYRKIAEGLGVSAKTVWGYVNK